MYAEDTQLYVLFNPLNYRDCTSKMQRCTVDIQKWMFMNHLKLNMSTKEVLVTGNLNDIRKIKEQPSVYIRQDTAENSNSA